MGRPLLTNTSNVMKVESALSNDITHAMRDLAQITGCRKPTLLKIFKSDLQMPKAFCKLGSSENDCGYVPASYDCNLSDVINDVRRWIRPITAQTLLFDFFLHSLHVNAETIEEFTSRIQ